MNINEFLSSAGEPIVYRLYCRKSNSGKLTYTLQLAQAFDLGSANQNERTAWLLSQTQGPLNASRITTQMNLSKEKAYELADMIEAPFTTEMEQEAMSTGMSVFAYRPDGTDAPILFNKLDFFNQAVGIEITESPFPSPYRPNQQPVINPSTNLPKTYVNADGEMVEKIYRHTEVVPAALIKHQFISNYFEEGSRKYDVSTENQLKAEKTKKVATGSEHIVTG